MSTRQKVIICVILLIISVICGGCVEDFISNLGGIGIIDSVSVNEKGDVALCLDDEVYITDLMGSSFTKVTDNKYCKGSVSWAKDGILYAEKLEDVWTLNLYRQNEGSTVLFQEMDRIVIPAQKEELSYVVLPKEELFGNINIYKRDKSQVYTVLDNAYYDYEWMPGTRKIVAINATNVTGDKFQGSLLIKDIDNLSEEIIFNGTFTAGWDYLDIRNGNNIIFSSEGKIYLYNIEAKELSEWEGKEGYDYRLPLSVNSSLKGYILAKVKGVEGDWSGQLYLVKPNGEFISIPGWPIWINEPKIICMDSDNLDIIVKDLEKNEIVDFNKRLEEDKISKETPRVSKDE